MASEALTLQTYACKTGFRVSLVGYTKALDSLNKGGITTSVENRGSLNWYEQ